MTPVLWKEPIEYISVPDSYSRWIGHFVPGDNNTPTANLQRKFVRDGIYNDVIISVTIVKTQFWNPANCVDSIGIVFLTPLPPFITINQLDEMHCAIHECKRKIHQYINNNIIPKINESYIR